MNKTNLVYLFALVLLSTSVLAHKAALEDEEIVNE